MPLLGGLESLECDRFSKSGVETSLRGNIRSFDPILLTVSLSTSSDLALDPTEELLQEAGNL